MKGSRRQRREEDDRRAAEAAAVAADVTCPDCGRVFAGAAALAIGHDQGRCLPDEAYGQLVRLPGGRWAERWRHPGRR